MQEDDKNVDDETQMLMASDLEIGHFLRARIIPKAIQDDDGEEEEEEEMEEAGEEEDDEPTAAKNR